MQRRANNKILPGGIPLHIIASFGTHLQLLNDGCPVPLQTMDRFQNKALSISTDTVRYTLKVM
ncbi:hypothetical protein DPMN_131843 [Dreissena polymorpha]|uniref:Uncharacterized protein n=1 Tax=Dreissena polymorpha TaxID=45954 RepID=A0A9D4FTX8_DREPO|nr:hypothetical protein DPMN_131843 [Dreissena polymorpha]